MRSSPILGAVAVVIGSVLSAPTVSVPGKSLISARQWPALDEAIIEGIIDIALTSAETAKQEKNTYEMNSDMCMFQFGTSSGSNCYVDVVCPRGDSWALTTANIVPGGKSVTGPITQWNSCFLNGIQYFHADAFGDFSIQFTKAGGQNGDTEDGLHTPIFRARNMDNGAPIDVQAQTDSTQKFGKFCTWDSCGDGTFKNNFCWKCGFPPIGSQFRNLSNKPAPASTFHAGTCGVHFIDYQIPSGDNKYYTAARVVDASGALVAQVGNSYSVGTDRVSADGPVGLSGPGVLPYVLIYTRPRPGSSKSPDGAAIVFDYAGNHWDTNSPSCKVGNFDGGARQGDCTFPC